MRSFFTGDGGTPAFRTSWRGYDRAEVDAFLRQTAADRQRLQEDLAQLEAFTATSGDERREVERLAAIRREVASCLETSIGALRTATGLLASVTPPAAQAAPTPIAAISEHLYHDRPSLTSRLDFSRLGRLARILPVRPSWPVDTRKRVLVGVGSVAALMFGAFLYQNQPRANEMPAPPAEVRTAVPPPAPAQTPPAAASAAPPLAEAGPTSAPAPAREDGLVLTVTARRACWIGTTLDGGQRLERMLAPNETIMLRATSEAVLRVGDASALSVLINNQPTKPLGATGQVVTHRITKANYKSLLEN
jgi:DivIVA domain-containing protein